MAQRYIYLSDELNIRLKNETNASGLIQRLLENYYKSINIKNLSRDEILRMIEKKKLEQKHKEEMEALDKNGKSNNR